jgi:undecaprenyl-diphosphatase
MTRIRSAPLTRLAEVLDVVGGGAVNVIVVVVAVVVVLVVAGPWRAALTGAAALLEAGLVSALKAFSAQPRPSGHLVAVSGAAFPSGHASSAAFLAVSLALLAPRVWTWAIAVGWMLAMDLSRTYLSVHWLVDVVGGSLLGAALATLAWALAPRTSSAPTATG